MLKEFDEILRIEGNPPSQKAVFEKRMNRVNEAMGWAVGTWEDKMYHTIWEKGDYKIVFGKPGKESTRDSGYTGVELNPHDMRPEIFYKNINLNLAATFGNVIGDLEDVAKVDKYCVELLAVLFFRSAFLLDHKEQKDATGNRIYRYAPNQEVVSYISEKIPEMYNLPPEVFLQYLDAIALNEDVKYNHKGKDLSKDKTGGNNNYRTYVMVTAVITGDLPISSIAKLLLRSNVSPISNKDALAILPHLAKSIVSPYLEAIKTVKVPMYDSIGCGDMMHADTISHEFVEVDENLIKKGSKFFVLRTAGDSMNNSGIETGDLVLCRKDYHPEDGNIVVALVGDDATLKKYRREQDSIVLSPHSTNAEHKELRFYAGDDVKVQGVMIQVLK